MSKSTKMENCFFRVSTESFTSIPGSPIGYWASETVKYIFGKSTPLSNLASIGKGLDTGDNNRFLRQWFEVGLNQDKWLPCQKGGQYRKWYGNNDYVINWFNDGEELKAFPGSNLRNAHNYLKQGITWTRISSSSTAFRFLPEGQIFESTGPCLFPEKINIHISLSFLNSKVTLMLLKIIAPTLDFQSGHISSLPILSSQIKSLSAGIASQCVQVSKADWDSYETSWDFTNLPLIQPDFKKPTLQQSYQALRTYWQAQTDEMQQLEEENNRIFIEAYGLQDELTPDVPLKEITLTCNPHYRYGGERSDEELETLLQCDTIKELVSYAIGCMMGRYSLDKSGLILASQGETLDDYYRQIPVASFAPDDDGILPLNDQEWFADDATNRVREFVREVWGEDKLRENLDFIAESLCLHAIKAKKGEDSLDCIRRYLSTQFFKDHMRMYKNRPIYWLFSSGKHKAFECLVYLHRYNEGTLARMRTEYLIPLSAKLKSYAEKLEQDKEASTSAAEIKSLEKQITDLHNQQAELAEYDEQLRHYADQRIQLDLDDGVKVNYGKFGTLLAEVKKVAG